MNPSNIIHHKHDLKIGHGAEQIAGGIQRIAQLLQSHAARGTSNLTRRDLLRHGFQAAGGLLAATAAGTLLPRSAAADEAVKTGQFIFPRLQFSVYDETRDIWNTGPVGDANLRRKLQELTNINVSNEPRVVHLGDFDDMCRNPFVFMTSEGYFKLPDNEEKNLREFLERGGFIHADDCVYRNEDRFFRFYVDLLGRLFPDNPMRQIPNDHEIYHIYFDMPMWPGGVSPCPHMQGVDHGAWGLFERGTGRIMTVATAGDLHCGWTNQFWDYNHTLACIKMGINIIIYFLSH